MGAKKNVFIVGGANSAGQAACFFSKHPDVQVVMLVRGKELNSSMSQYLIDRICTIKNIEVWYQAEVLEAHGHERLDTLVIRREGQAATLPADALHIFIGAMPKTYWLNGLVEKDPKGFILTGPRVHENWKLERDPLKFETSMPGVLAAGDVRLGSIKRVVAATGEGSVAVQDVHNYLQLLHNGDSNTPKKA